MPVGSSSCIDCDTSMAHRATIKIYAQKPYLFPDSFDLFLSFNLRQLYHIIQELFGIFAIRPFLYSSFHIVPVNLRPHSLLLLPLRWVLDAHRQDLRRQDCPISLWLIYNCELHLLKHALHERGIVLRGRLEDALNVHYVMVLRAIAHHRDRYIVWSAIVGFFRFWLERVWRELTDKTVSLFS